MTTLRQRGFQAERILARKLWEAGFACVRGPASGSGGKHVFYPDLVAIRNGVLLILEVKKTSKDYVYLKSEKLKKMFEFAERAKGESSLVVWVMLAVHSKSLGGWRFIPLDFLKEELLSNTFKLKSIKVKFSDLKTKLTITELQALTDKFHKITNFMHKDKEGNHCSSMK